MSRGNPKPYNPHQRVRELHAALAEAIDIAELFELELGYGKWRKARRRLSKLKWDVCYRNRQLPNGKWTK